MRISLAFPSNVHGNVHDFFCFVCLLTRPTRFRAAAGVLRPVLFIRAATPPSLVKAVTAATCSRLGGAASLRLRVPCSDALAALIRGYKAITVTAVPPPEHAGEARPGNDTLATVDFRHVLQAAEFAEAVLRRLAEKEDT